MAEDSGHLRAVAYRMLRACRLRMIMSNRAPLTCGVLAGEQCGLAGVPDDHEQSGAGRERLASKDAVTACGGSYRELLIVFRPRRSATPGITTKRNR
jgi:hypothetical protein